MFHKKTFLMLLFSILWCLKQWSEFCFSLRRHVKVPVLGLTDLCLLPLWVWNDSDFPTLSITWSVNNRGTKCCLCHWQWACWSSRAASIHHLEAKEATGCSWWCFQGHVVTVRSGWATVTRYAANSHWPHSNHPCAVIASHDKVQAHFH